MASPKPINSGVAAGKGALAGRCHNPQINWPSRSARRLHLEQSCYINSTMNKPFPQGPKQPPAGSQNNTGLAGVPRYSPRIIPTSPEASITTVPWTIGPSRQRLLCFPYLYRVSLWGVFCFLSFLCLSASVGPFIPRVDPAVLGCVSNCPPKLPD